jgi:serine/threonine protein kinase
MHNPVIVMELATRGSLQTLIAQPQSIETKLRAIHDIATGMEQLHSCNPPIGHRDLKSANVLVNSDGDCLIADFGLSKTVGTIVSESATASGAAQQHSFGTPQWSSPEFMQHKVDWSDPVQAQAADVWSFGIVIWEILTGEQPWRNYTIVQLVAAAIAGETLPIPLFPECPELCDMIADCWSRIPHERPTFFDLIQRIVRLSSSASPVQLPPRPPSSPPPLPPRNDKHTAARASAHSGAPGGNFPAATHTVSPGTTAQQAGGAKFDVNTGKRLWRSEGAKFDFRTGKPTSLPPFKPTDRVPGLVEEVVNYNIARMSGLRKQITVRIMVIGPPGVGKSSYINTARAVFSGEAWAEDAEGGPGHDTVTEVASSYPLLTDRPDHIRFTDTRGWRGVTDEAVAFFKDLGRREVDGKTTDMLRFEEKAPRKTLANLVSAFQNVGNMHHVVVFFIDAYHQYFRPERALPPSLTSAFKRRERPDATLSIVVDEIVAIYSAFKDSSHGAFEPVFFITKADRVRQMKPAWSVSELVQDIVTSVNSQKALGRRGSKGRPLAVRPNQFHEIRSCGSRDEYEELVETKQWVEVQRLHALALARVLPRASALIRKQVEK